MASGFASPTNPESPDLASLVGSANSEERLDSDIEADLQHVHITASNETGDRFSLDSSDTVFTDTSQGPSPRIHSETKNLQSLFFRSTFLSGVSNQLASYSSKIDVGSPTCISLRKYLAVGTMKGVIFVFDMKQVLRFCSGLNDTDLPSSTSPTGAVTVLTQKPDGSQLLAGYQSGRIAVWELVASHTTSSKPIPEASTVQQKFRDEQDLGEATATEERSSQVTHSLTSLLFGGARIGSASRVSSRLLCVVDDAHGVGQSIAFCTFTTRSSRVVCVDTGGSVFQLEFKRGLIGLNRESVCFFSGSRGEICNIEALFPSSTSVNHDCTNTIKQNNPNDIVPSSTHSLSRYALVAMTSFTKLIIVTLHPRIQIVHWQPLKGPASCLPLLAWNWNAQRCASCHVATQAILAFSRGSVVHLLRVSDKLAVDALSESNNQNPLSFQNIRTLDLSYSLISLKWMPSGNQLLALDRSEYLRLIRSSDGNSLADVDVSSIHLCYNFHLFRTPSHGGSVSEALAFAGERACMHSVVLYGSQVLLLGNEGIYLFTMRRWSEIVQSLFNRGQIDTALAHCEHALHSLLPTDPNTGPSLYRDPPIKLKLHSLPPVNTSSPHHIRREIQSLFRQHLFPIFCDLGHLKCAFSPSCLTLQTAVSICSYLSADDLTDLYSAVNHSEQWKSWYFISLFRNIQMLRPFGLLSNIDSSMAHEPNEFQSIYHSIPPEICMDLLNWCLDESFQSYRLQDDKSIDSNLNSITDIGRNWAQICLLRLSPSSFDLDRAVKLSLSHGLYSAYLHLYTDVLMDFDTAFRQLLTCLQEELSRPTEEYSTSVVESCGPYLFLLLRAALAGESCSGEALPSPMYRDIPFHLFKLLLNEAPPPPAGKKLGGMNYRYPRLRLLMEYNAVDFLSLLTLSLSSDHLFVQSELAPTHRVHLYHKLIGCALEATQAGTMATSSWPLLVLEFLVQKFCSASDLIPAMTDMDERVFQLYLQVCEFLSSGMMSATQSFEEMIVQLLSTTYMFNPSTFLQSAQEARLYTICEYVHQFRQEHLLALQDRLAKLQHMRTSPYPPFEHGLNGLQSYTIQTFAQMDKFLHDSEDSRSTPQWSDSDKLEFKRICLNNVDLLSHLDAERTLHLLFSIFRVSITELLHFLTPQFSRFICGASVDGDFSAENSTFLLLRAFFQSQKSILDRFHEDTEREGDDKLVEGSWERFLSTTEPSVAEYFVYLMTKLPDTRELLLSFLADNRDYRTKIVLQLLPSSVYPYECACIHERLGEYDQASHLYEKTFLDTWRRFFEQISTSIDSAEEPLPMILSKLRSQLQNAADSWFAFCQRQTTTTSTHPSPNVEIVWFRLIDTLMCEQNKLTDNLLITEMNELFHSLLSYVPRNIRMASIISYVLQNIGKTQLNRFNEKTNTLVTRLVSTCQFEVDQLTLNKQLTRHDLTNLQAVLYRRFKYGFTHLRTGFACSSCDQRIRSTIDQSRKCKLCLFRCGHLYHKECLTVDDQTVCPQCDSTQVKSIAASKSVMNHKVRPFNESINHSDDSISWEYPRCQPQNPFDF